MREAVTYSYHPSMSVPANHARDRSSRAHQIPRWQRATFGTSGAILVGITSWQVLVSDKDSIAIVTLLVSGVAFCLLAILGIVPDYISAKDLSYKITPQTEADAEAIVDYMPPALRATLADSATAFHAPDKAAGDSRVAEAISDAAQRSLAFQKRVEKRIHEAWWIAYPIDTQGPLFTADPSGLFDLSISMGPAGTIGVATLMQGVSDSQVRLWETRISSESRSAVLVVSQESPSTSALLRMKQPPITFVGYDEQLRVLADAIRSSVDYINSQMTATQAQSGPPSLQQLLDP